MGKRTQKRPLKRAPRKPAWRGLARKTLIPLIRANPERMLELLDEHGVTFCAGCYLTFSGPLERVAAYHAVPHPERFLADVAKAVAAGKRGNHV